MTLSVAVVGAGPSGFYAADAMLKAFPGCEVDIIDRWPVPFGLVRYGVAPDHLSTKNVVKLYEKIFDKPGIRFLGNVEVGRDVSYEELKSFFDVVILACGMEYPKQFDIPGAELDGVVSVTDFVGWYNGVPESPDFFQLVSRARSAVIVGNGNVALDVARLLAKTKAELVPTDIVPMAADAISVAPLSNIYVVGRRGPLEANFSFPELSEFGNLRDAEPIVDPRSLPVDATSVAEKERKKKERNLRVLRTFSEKTAGDKSVKVHLLFFMSPVGILGEPEINAVKMVRNTLVDGKAVATKDTFMLDADLLVPAIGYQSAPITGVPTREGGSAMRHQDGRVEAGVYVVGWARRGPTGVIGTNRVDSREVVDRIVVDSPTAFRQGSVGLDNLLSSREVNVVAVADWRRINEAEMRGAVNGRPRTKFTTVVEMLKLLSG